MKYFLVVASVLLLSFSAVAEQGDIKVTVYGHTGCPWTQKALNYLDKRNVAYTLMDVKNDDDANRDFYARGYKKIPQVLVGEERVSGWRKGRLRKLLQANDLLASVK